MLVWRNGNIEKNYTSLLQYCVLLQWCLQVGRLYQALILLGLVLCLPSTSVSLCYIKKISYIYLFTFW